MPRVLVTGGCGFVGSNLVRRLLRKYPNLMVFNFDHVFRNLGDLNGDQRHVFCRGDITDEKAVKDVVRGVDTVFHLAETKLPNLAPKTNVLGTQILLDAAKGVRRFVHVSSDVVYGSLKPGDDPPAEDAPLRPDGPYPASKAGADLMVRSYFKTHGFPAIVVRGSNSYGPFQHPAEMVPFLVGRAIREDRMPAGGVVRNWVHVSDHVEAICAVWEYGEAGKVYNVGGRVEVSDLDLTRMLAAAMKKSSSLIDPEDRDGRYSVNPEMVEKLGWRPKVRLDTGLKATAQWYERKWCA